MPGTTFDVTGSMKALSSFLRAANLMGDIRISEPKSPPVAPTRGGSSVAASVFMDDAEVVERTIDGETTERHLAIVRLTSGFIDEPTGDAETDLAEKLNQIMKAIGADADLGERIRVVDFGGIYGRPVRARWGYINIGGTMFRSVDLEIPMIVDGNVTQDP